MVRKLNNVAQEKKGSGGGAGARGSESEPKSVEGGGQEQDVQSVEKKAMAEIKKQHSAQAPHTRTFTSKGARSRVEHAHHKERSL